MARQSQDVVVRFIGDTGNLGHGLDGLQARFRTVTSSLDGIAKAGAAIGAVSFFKTAIDEAREAARTTRQTEAVLKSTGGVANVTADHISELAGKMSELAGVDDEVIQHGANLLLTFTKVRNEMGAGNDIFDQAAKVSLDMAAAMSEAGDAGAGLQENVIRIGKALNDPVKGMTALQKVGVTFSADQKERIKAFVEEGDVLNAQKIILGELQTEFGGMAEASTDSTAKAQVGFKNFAEEVGLRVLPAVNAVSDWANNTGLPALTKVADVALDVLIPAVRGIVTVGHDVVKFFMDLPGPVQGAVAAFVAWKLVGDNVTGMFGKLSGPVRGFGSDVQTVMQASQGEVGRFGASLQVLQDRVPTIGAMGAAFRSTKGDAEGLGSTLKGTLAAGFEGVKGAATGLVSFLGGPWGIAITAASLGLTYWISKHREAEQHERDLAAAGKSVADAIREQNGVINENVRQIAAKNAEDKGLLKGAQALNIPFEKVTDAILGQGDSYSDLRDGIRSTITAKEQLVSQLAAEAQYQADANGQSAASNEEAQRRIATLYEEIDANKQFLGTLDGVVNGKNNELNAQLRVAQAAGDSAVAQQLLKTAQDDNSVSGQMLQGIIESLGMKFDNTKGDAENLATAIEGITKSQQNAIDLEENYEAALDSLTESIRTNGATLDIHTEKGRNNRDALEAAAKAIQDMAIQDIQAGVPAEEAIARHDRRVEALQREANKAGFAKDESQKLIDTYSRIPSNVRTVIETLHAEEVYQKLLDMNLAQRALAEGISIRQAKGLYGDARAAGGYISGPGGPTSDVIPIWASNGEYMHRASAVGYYGLGVMEAMNQRRIPRDVFQPQYAQGGLVTWPMWVNAAKTKVPQFGAAIPVGAAGAGVQRWAPLVLQALALLRQPSSLLGSVLRRMNQESGGNPNAINNWDINAQRGDPSRGLMQTIGSTFNAYAGPFRDRGIYDPFANIYAGLNYAIHRYPSLQYAMDKPGGYKDGGWLQPGKLAYNETSRPELLVNERQLAGMGRDIHVHIHGTVITNDRDLENVIVRAVDRAKGKGRI